MRIPLDQYGTPAWSIHRLLEARPLPAGCWLDPCAGGGAILGAVAARRTDILWSTYEIDRKYEAALRAHTNNVEIADFLSAPIEPRSYPPLYDVVITNPPYSLAEEFIRKCQKLAGITAMLLRINFLESAARAEWLRAWTPDIYVLPNRPSFTGRGTDATGYCWALWDWQRENGRGSLRILAPTPKAERKMR